MSSPTESFAWFTDCSYVSGSLTLQNPVFFGERYFKRWSSDFDSSWTDERRMIFSTSIDKNWADRVNSSWKPAGHNFDWDRCGNNCVVYLVLFTAIMTVDCHLFTFIQRFKVERCLCTLSMLGVGVWWFPSVKPTSAWPCQEQTLLTLCPKHSTMIIGPSEVRSLWLRHLRVRNDSRHARNEIAAPSNCARRRWLI